MVLSNCAMFGLLAGIALVTFVIATCAQPVQRVSQWLERANFWAPTGWQQVTVYAAVFVTIVTLTVQNVNTVPCGKRDDLTEVAEYLNVPEPAAIAGCGCGAE